MPSGNHDQAFDTIPRPRGDATGAVRARGCVAALVLVACSGGAHPFVEAPDASPDAALDDAALDASPDYPAPDVHDAFDAFDALDARDVADVPDAGDATEAPDVASDAPPEVVILNGCPVYEDPVDHPGAPPGDDTWAAFARGFFARWCVGCHSVTLTTSDERMGAPSGTNWDDEAAVRADLLRIRGDVGVSNFMPRAPPLPSCDERRRLVRWIDIGAP